MSVLVVGGAGFLGSAVAAELAARGERVHVLCRRARPGDAGPVTVHVGDARKHDLGLPTSEAGQLLDEVTAVVVSVGSYDIGASIAHTRDEHVAPVLGSLQFARRCGQLRTVVHVSSVLMAGDTTMPLRSDDVPLAPRHRNFYEWGKYQGEVLARQSGLPVDVVRPGHVLNATDGSRRVARAGGVFDGLPYMLAGYPLVLGDLDKRYWCCPVDLAAAIVAERAVEGKGGTSVWAVDPGAPTYQELLDCVTARYHLRNRRVRLPRAAQALLMAVDVRRLGVDVPRQALDYARASYALDLRCLHDLAEAAGIAFPTSRGYVVDTIEHEVGRLRELA